MVLAPNYSRMITPAPPRLPVTSSIAPARTICLLCGLRKFPHPLWASGLISCPESPCKSTGQ